MVGAGARYGASDKVVCKWLRRYEADIAKQAGEALAAGGAAEIRMSLVTSPPQPSTCW